MSYDYEGFRFTTNINIGAGENTYSGFASRVDGKLGFAFTIATATGAMMGLNKITVADGDMAVISIGKTTKQNSGTLKLSATTAKPSEKEAAGLKADVGFADIVTAVDGMQYRILQSSAYVVVNSSHFNYELSATQSVKAKELFENVEQLLGSTSWREAWAKAESATKGKNVDVISWVYSNLPETRSVIDGCRSILGEVPVVTYEMTVKNGKDTEAPVIAPDSITIITTGNHIKAECTGATDNYFVYGFEYEVLDENGVSVEAGTSQNGTQTIRPKLSLGDGSYTLRVRAYDYSMNFSDWVDTAITVNNKLYIDTRELKSSTEPLPLTQKQTVEKDYPADYTITPEHSGSYNLILQNLDNRAKITITEYSAAGGKVKRLRSKTMTAENFAKGAGALLFDKDKTYTISVSSNQTANYTVAVSGTAFVDANKIPEDNWVDLKTIHDVTSDMKVMVQTSDQQLISDEWVGFTDKLDVRELEITTAGKLTIDLTTNNKTRMSVYVENPKNGKLKKLKSISVGSVKTDSVTKSIKSLLLGVGTYYLVVEAPGAAKGSNADYSVGLDANSSELFKKADMNPLDNDFTTAPLLDCSKAGTLISGEWVGFGDQFDYFRVPAGDGGGYEFAIGDADSQLRLTVYEVVVKKSGDEKLKNLKKVTTKEKDDWSGTTGLLQFAQGKEYIVAVENPKASKGAGSDYSLELKQAQAFNWDNNTKETATVLTDAGFEGVISNANGSDLLDYIDLRQFSDDLSIEMISGKAKVSLYNADNELIDTFRLNVNNGIEFNAADSGCAYMRIDAESKKLNQYAIAIA